MVFRPLLLLAAALIAGPAAAQMRVVIDGRAQDVPAGVVRTITYMPDGREIVRDERVAGAWTPGAAVVSTTETTDEDASGRVLATNIVVRIAPVAAAAMRPPALLAYAPTPPAPAEDMRSVAADETEQAERAPIRLRRDPATGHYIAAIRINGVAVRAIVDTGAQSTILSARDAWATGAARDITGSTPMAGIGGLTRLAVAHVRSFDIGGQRLGGFDAAIGAEGFPYTLLGQTEIARLGRIVIEDGEMTISPRPVRMAAR